MLSFRAVSITQKAPKFCSFFSTDVSERLLSLNDLSNIKEATKNRKKWGRGIGSGRGKNSGFGHQKSRCTPRGFEGGQTPLYKRLPKIGFTNHGHKEYQTVNLDKIQQFIDMGRLVPKPNAFITMRDLQAAGLISQVKDGVKLLAGGKEDIKAPVHVEVTCASASAIAAVEAAGGTVTAVHFNSLALRALMEPYKFGLLPMRARPQSSQMDFYLDRTKAGYLSPEIQMRNLKLFGYVTSEVPLRAEHDNFMNFKRHELKLIRQQVTSEAAQAQSAGASN